MTHFGVFFVPEKKLTFIEWESKAKNSYGSRVKYKANSVVTGDSGSSRIASGESGVLKNYQKLMRSVRLKARQEGFNIPQSEYETVSF